MPPPFPVVALPKFGKTNPPIPHIAVTAIPPDPEKPAEAPPRKKRGIPKVALIAAAAVLVLGGGFFAWQQFAPPPPPPPPPPKAKAPAKVAAPAGAPLATGAAKSAAGPTPSDTLNALAKAPVNAVNKAQDAIAARRAGEQNRVELADGSADLANKPAAKAPPATKATTGVTTLSPGVSATTEIESASEASPTFRSFVANAKIGGVFQSASGSVARVFMNGRMMRAGETVDVGLGIVFDGVDPEKRNVIFKDKTGATVTRWY